MRLQLVAPLAPAGPTEGDTFPDPHNALGHRGHGRQGAGVGWETPQRPGGWGELC